MPGPAVASVCSAYLCIFCVVVGGAEGACVCVIKLMSFWHVWQSVETESLSPRHGEHVLAFGSTLPLGIVLFHMIMAFPCYALFRDTQAEPILRLWSLASHPVLRIRRSGSVWIKYTPRMPKLNWFKSWQTLGATHRQLNRTSSASESP